MCVHRSEGKTRRQCTKMRHEEREMTFGNRCKVSLTGICCSAAVMGMFWHTKRLVSVYIQVVINLLTWHTKRLVSVWGTRCVQRVIKYILRSVSTREITKTGFRPPLETNMNNVSTVWHQKVTLIKYTRNVKVRKTKWLGIELRNPSHVSPLLPY